MNMISTGSFLTEMDASNKQSELVRTLTRAWEKKNSKAARAGGVSLMALSLAACGSSEDDTPFSQADIDTAVAAVDITSDNDAVIAAAIAALPEDTTPFAQADIDAAVAAVDITSDNGPLVAAAEAAEEASAEALVAQAAAEDDAAAANAALLIAQADKATAEAALADAQTALTDAQTALTTKTAEYDDLVASNTTLQQQYDALIAPRSVSLEAGALANTGGEGDDTFSGSQAAAGDTFDAGDNINGGNGSDTLNITSSEATINAATISSVETINITTTVVGGSAVGFDAANVTGGDTINITREDVGAISGTGAATVSNLSTGAVNTVNAISGVSSLVVEQQTGDGVAVNATGVTGNVTLHGSGTVVANSAASTATVTVADVDIAAAALAAAGLDGAVSVTTTAGTVSVGMGGGALTGDVTIDASAAATINVDTTGAVNITSGAATLINVDNTDASGATITSARTGTTTAPTVIALDGTTATAADVMTISAIGAVTLDDQGDALETLNLSGNGAAATYTIDTGLGFTSITATGSSDVNVTSGADDFDAITVTGVNTLTFNGAASAAVDLTNVAAATINLGTQDHSAEDITVKDGANLVVANDQTGFDVFAATDNGTVTVTTADDVAGSAVGTITLGAVDMNDTKDHSGITLVANDAHLTATSFDADDATVTVLGTRNVDLGTVTAGSVNASSASGTLDLAMSATLTSVNGSTGVNTISLNGAAVMTLNTYDGADIITVTAVSDGSVINTGAGNDDITLTDAGANAFDLGTGNDVVDVAQNADIDSVIVFGEGTDSIEFDSTANVDLADNTNFAMYGVETVDVTATVGGITISAAQFALDDTFALTGNAAADTLIIEAAAGGSTITTTNVTLTSGATATLTINGGAGADTINGGALGETIDGGDGIDSISAGAGNDTINIDAAADLESGDVIDGGTGTDTINYTVAAAADLSVATITNVETIDFNGASATLQQGTGATTVEGYADGTADTLTLLKSSTNFEAAAEASAGAVDIAGEWFFLQETALADGALTVFDEVLGEAITIALDGTAGAGADDAAAMVAGSLVVTIA